MRIGFNGSSYTSRSTAVADEECINFFAETLESQGAIAPARAYGGSKADSMRSYYGTPGLAAIWTFSDGPVRGSVTTGSTPGVWDRVFFAAGAEFCELQSNGNVNVLAAIANDGSAVSMANNGVQILVVSAGHAYCFSLATDTMVEVTGDLAGVPIKVEFADGYFIVCFAVSNKFQLSDILDGTTWPGLLVNEVSVFSENIVSIITNHRELWVLGQRHTQPYQNTGSDSIFDPLPGCLIEMGCAATFAPCRLDNSVFWIDENERGARSAWRSQGYTPQRISTHAVETDLESYQSIAGLVSYAYQDAGHMFWVLYIPGSHWSWVYDVGEQMWHKRAKWYMGQYWPHWGWNHVYAFGKHLIGDWDSPNLYEMSMEFLDDAGTPIRRLRRAPTIGEEMQWIQHAELTVDFDTGQGTEPQQTDADGNLVGAQAMLRWSDDRGKTWSNEHWVDCGAAGAYKTRAIWRRLGRSRYRVYELVVSDPAPWAIVDAYLRPAGQP